jgi:predicted transcriptional regulator
VENLPDVSMEEVVDDICEPFANKQRLTIMKALVLDSRSFTDLSKLTGLRGGNLLFHLQKLVDKGMILQRNERGDYIITSKGHSVFKGIMDIYSSVIDNENG